MKIKQFTETKFIRTLQDASQNGIDIDAQVLDNEYDEFVLPVFHESAASTDRAAYLNTLAYTREKLGSLTEVSGKKCGNLCQKSA
jgi:hypothetical protein